jgi:UDP-N-acetylglucosamine--dolichyl-phosphate N-acetylglucosaminephosphotransferase
MVPHYQLILFAVSFFLTLLLLPYWMRKAQQIGLVWKDMNKYQDTRVAGSGGVIVLGSFIVAVLFFIAYQIFFLQSQSHLVEILSMLVTITLLGGIGLMDDLLGWQRGGLSRRSRIVLVLLAAFPLIAINAGRASMELPFIGVVDLGLLYPLLFIPLGIVGASTTFNFLAGFNGLEAGQGILILTALSIVAYFTGNVWLAVIGLCMVASLLAFLIFNFSPARIFPGDCLTYPIGGMIAIMTILGNFEKIALWFFIPIIIEVVLKARGRFVKPSFGRPQKDGSLDVPYPTLYGLTHVALWMQKRIGLIPNEKRAVFMIWGFQLIIILLGFAFFHGGIFG